MNREHSQDALIDLGKATEATKGTYFGGSDQEVTLRPIAGLSDD